MTSTRASLLSLLLLLISLSFCYYLWSYYMLSPWTRDARIHADVSLIAPQTAGKVAEVLVSSDHFVEQGQLLFRLDGIDQTLALRQAQAALVKAKAERQLAKDERQRLLDIPQTLTSEEEREQAQTTLEARIADVQRLQAELEQSQVNLQRIAVTAPHRGYVSDVNLTAGQVVNSGQVALALVNSDSFNVKAYFEETRIHGVQVGASARIKLMGRSDLEITGTVSAISRGINNDNTAQGSRHLPEVQQTFPWIRLAQRIPVTIEFDLAQIPKDALLISGASAAVVIE